MSTALARKEPTGLSKVNQTLMNNKDKLYAAIPKGVDGDVCLQKVIQEFRRNPKLAKCTAPSLIAAVCEGMSYGLEIGGPKAQAYIVPRWSGKDQAELANFQISYKGWMELGRRTSQITAMIPGFVVGGQDPDDVIAKADQNSVVMMADPEDVTHVFWIFRLRDSDDVKVCWTTEQINKHKEQYSDAWRYAETAVKGKKGSGQKDSTWHKSWLEMAMKTVIQWTFKRDMLPTSESIQTAVQSEQIRDGGEVVNMDAIVALDSIIDGEPETKQLPPAEPEPETVSPPADAHEAIARLTTDLSAAKSAGAVTSLESEYGDLFPEDEDYQFNVDQLVTLRREAMRATK